MCTVWLTFVVSIVFHRSMGCVNLDEWNRQMKEAQDFLAKPTAQLVAETKQCMFNGTKCMHKVAPTVQPLCVSTPLAPSASPRPVISQSSVGQTPQTSTSIFVAIPIIVSMILSMLFGRRSRYCRLMFGSCRAACNGNPTVVQATGPVIYNGASYPRQPPLHTTATGANPAVDPSQKPHPNNYPGAVSSITVMHSSHVSNQQLQSPTNQIVMLHQHDMSLPQRQDYNSHPAHSALQPQQSQMNCTVGVRDAFAIRPMTPVEGNSSLQQSPPPAYEQLEKFSETKIGDDKKSTVAHTFT